MFELDEGILKEVEEEAIKNLCDYLKIDTSNPPGLTDEAIDFWRRLYEKEAIPYRIYTHSSGKQSICGFITKEYTKCQESIVLLNHIDVVPVDNSKWEYGPFEGEVKDNYIRGRGALDMKGLAIIQLMAALIIKRNKYPIRNNIIVLSVADEEVGGFNGAKFIVENYLNDLKPSLVLDEGAFGLITEANCLFYVSYSQKKTLWLKIFAQGKSGHAAIPSKENANNILIKALAKIEENAIQRPHLKNNLLYNSIKSKRCCKVRKSPYQKILFFNTISITSMISKSAPNVIPDYAEAIIDCRLTPDTDVETFIRNLRMLINDRRITIEVIKRTDIVGKSDCKHEIIDVIRKVILNSFSTANIIPIVAPVGTDSKFFRDSGINCYGFFPILLRKEDLNMMHGANEQISVENLMLGIKILTEVLTNYN